MSSYISLTYSDLLLASIFLAMNALFSILLRLRLERQLVVSALRMITQLLLVVWSLRPSSRSPLHGSRYWPPPLW